MSQITKAKKLSPQTLFPGFHSQFGNRARYVKRALEEQAVHLRTTGTGVEPNAPPCSETSSVYQYPLAPKRVIQNPITHTPFPFHIYTAQNLLAHGVRTVPLEVAEAFPPPRVRKLRQKVVQGQETTTVETWEVKPINPLRKCRSLITLKDMNQEESTSGIVEGTVRLSRWESCGSLAASAPENDGYAGMYDRELPAPKRKVYFRGRKREQRINRVADKEVDTKPQFIVEPTRVPKPQMPFTMTPCTRDMLLRSLSTDADLLYELKLEAFGVPRTPLLIQQLKQKAKRFIAQWDMSLYTTEQVYQMIARSIAQAMMIDKEEERLRAAMNLYTEKTIMRPLHTQFFQLGKTTSAESSSLSHIGKKPSVVRKFLRKRLIRVIKF